MSSIHTCGDCGKAIPADSPGGFCAQCLLGLGLGKADEPAGEKTAQPPEAEEAKPERPGCRLPCPNDNPSVLVPPTEKAGDRIGRYRLLEEIGHGGCGVVYMAEQEQPIRRKVALKVIKLGMDTRQVVARFEAERQALALMDHPNIAKVLDAGATELGRPYFVMELVGGIKITDYCGQNQLGTRQRLDLFIQVCRAIQHAHQKGVIHRDIKPSNVLVAIQDGVPVAKVIDFGIAKATQGRLTDQTVFTAFEQFLGTPAYMSPEQAQLGGMDVDTRSDIYSLGVLLYELLTGSTPFDTKELLAAGMEAMRRTIQEDEPPTPSSRLAQHQVVAKSPAADQPSAIDRDLDWIVMRCLEKDRARRYETANGLTRDIERHLNNEPVVARPPSRAYRLRKLVRRHKLAFGAGALVATVLVAGIVASTWQAIRATNARALALSEKRRADEEAAKQEAINRFLNDMLASADPDKLSPADQAKGPNITMLEVLDMAARQVEAGSLQDRPAIEAAICQTLGRTYLSLSQPARAEPLLRKALELHRRIYGERSDPAIGNLTDLSHLQCDRGRLDEAEALARRAIALEQELHGRQHPDVARALVHLGIVLSERWAGQHDLKTRAEAEETYRQALGIQRSLLPPQSPDLIPTLVRLGEFITGGKDVEAEALLREALHIQTTVRGQRHPETAITLKALAGALSSRREFAEAERLCKQALSVQQELFGTNHFALKNSLGRLALVLQQQQKFPEAEAAIRGILALFRQAVPGGLDVAWWVRELAANLVAQGRFAEAEIFCREGLQIWETFKGGGVGHEDYWVHLETLIRILEAQHKLDELESLYREVLARQRAALGDTHVALPALLCKFGDFLASRSRPGEAAELYRQASEMIPRLAAWRNQSATKSLAGSLRTRGKLTELRSLYEQLIYAESKRPENPNSYLGVLLHDYGDCLGLQHRFEAAAQQYLSALPIRRANQDILLAWTLRSLGNALIESSRVKEAELYFREELQLCRTLHHQDDLYCTAWPTKRLADALYQQRNLPEAERTYREALASYRNANAIDDPGFPEAARCLVELLVTEGELSKSQSVLEEVLVLERLALGHQDVRTAATLVGLAHTFQLQSKPERAADLCREAADIIAGSRPEELLRLTPAVVAEMLALGLAHETKQLCDRVLELSPATNFHAAWLNEASWSLILADKPAGRDSHLAVRLARKADELCPSKHYYPTGLGSALGPALYRSGDWPEAVKELEPVVENDEGNLRCRGLLFLAMAQQRLGNTEVAGYYFRQAADWLAERSLCDRKVVRLRAEAETLLFGEGAK